MDIEGMGYKTVDLLLNQQLISDPADIYYLRPEQLLAFEGWGEISVNKLMAAIDAARHRSLARLLSALSIRHVGGTVSRHLADRFMSIDALMSASEEEIASIGGFGSVIARSVKEWSDNPATRALIEKLRTAGVSLADEATESGPKSNLLEGLTFVVTGTLESMTREAAEAALVAAGGKVTGSVSKKTAALIAGANPGAAKVTKAADSGVPAIDEATLLRLLTEGPIALA